MNAHLIETLRSRIYTYVGYKGGASDFTVAQLGIACGGAAADAGRALLAALVR